MVSAGAPDVAGLKGQRVLIVGADSMIGHAFYQRLQANDIDVLPTTRRKPAPDGWIHCDLADLADTWPPHPAVDVAFLCAASTRLQNCEDDPQGTHRVNVEGTLEIARGLVGAGTFVVFLSTNQVLGGEQPSLGEDAPYAPQNEYGRQKAEAERGLLALGENVAIVRLTKVVAPDDPLFSQWRAALKAGEQVTPFSDMAFAAVSLDDAVRTLAVIGAGRDGGIWQVSAPHDISYADVAFHLASLWGQDPALVRPVSALECGIPGSFLPKYSSLDTSRLSNQFGITPPAPLVVLSDCLKIT